MLKELEDLINSPNTTERDLQEFFEEYPELIAGDHYDVVIPQAAISRVDGGEAWKADFILAPVEQTEFCKIIELKIPHMPLLKLPKSGHVSFSARVWNALAQLKDYFHSFDRDQVRKNFESKYGIDVYKPDLHLIAGRRWDLQWIDNIRELRSTSEIRIEDWDSMLQRLKRRYA